MKNNFITACIVLTIMFGSLLALQHRIDNELQEDNNAINILGQQINDLKKEIFDVRAESIESISRRELDNAYNVIEDNKRFIEYEVSMSRKSVQAFVTQLNADMERFDVEIKQSKTNDESLREQIQFILQELELLEDSLNQAEEPVPVVTPETLENIRGFTTVETPIEKEKWAYVLESGSQNKTTVIQKAVNRIKRKGSYSLTVMFDVSQKGKANVLNVESNSAPRRLESAVHSYVSKLNFTKDNIQFDCKMSFNLNVT